MHPPQPAASLESHEPRHRLPSSQRHVAVSGRYINRRSRRLETKFQRVAAFQGPWRRIVREQPREQSIDGNLTSEAIDVNLFRPGQILQPFFQRPPKRSCRRVCSRCRHHAARRRTSSTIFARSPIQLRFPKLLAKVCFANLVQARRVESLEVQHVNGSARSRVKRSCWFRFTMWCLLKKAKISRSVW